jgi:hypothetical protein
MSWRSVIAGWVLNARMGRRNAKAYLDVLCNELTDEEKKMVEKAVEEKMETGKVRTLEYKILLRQISKRISEKTK